MPSSWQQAAIGSGPTLPITRAGLPRRVHGLVRCFQAQFVTHTKDSSLEPSGKTLMPTGVSAPARTRNFTFARGGKKVSWLHSVKPLLSSPSTYTRSEQSHCDPSSLVQYAIGSGPWPAQCRYLTARLDVFRNSSLDAPARDHSRRSSISAAGFDENSISCAS